MIVTTAIPALLSIAIFLNLIPSIIGMGAFIVLMFFIGQSSHDGIKEWDDLVNKSQKEPELLKANFALNRTMKSVSAGAIATTILAIASFYNTKIYNTEGVFVIFIALIVFGIMMKKIVALEILHVKCNSLIKAHKTMETIKQAQASETKIDSLEQAIAKDADQFMECMAVLAKSQEEILEKLNSDTKTKKL